MKIKLFSILLSFNIIFIALLLGYFMSAGNSIIPLYIIFSLILLIPYCKYLRFPKAKIFAHSYKKNLLINFLFYPILNIFSFIYFFRIFFIYDIFLAIYAFLLFITFYYVYFKRITYQTFIYRLSLFHILLVWALLIIFPKFDYYGFQFYFSPEMVEKHYHDNFKDNKSLNKIVLSIEYLSEDKKYFKFGGVKRSYFDPYHIIETQQHEILISFRYDQVIKYSPVSKNLKVIQTPTNKLFLDVDGSYFYTGNYKTKSQNSSINKLSINNLKIEKSISISSDTIPYGYFLYDFMPDGFRDGSSLSNDNLILITLCGRIILLNKNSAELININRMFNILISGAFYPEKNLAFICTPFSIKKYDIRHNKTIINHLSFISHRCKFNHSKELLISANPLPIFHNITVLNINTFKKIKTFRNYYTKSCRAFSFSKDMKYLFTSDYFTGYVYIIDFKSEKIIDSFYAGPLIRALHYSDHHKKLFIGSGLGLFEYDLSKL